MILKEGQPRGIRKVVWRFFCSGIMGRIERVKMIALRYEHDERIRMRMFTGDKKKTEWCYFFLILLKFE